MNRFPTFLILLLTAGFPVHAQNQWSNTFNEGETLTYRIYYSSYLIDATAGEAVLTLKQYSGKKLHCNDTVYYATGHGISKGLFDFFFEVNDTYESCFDKQTLLPYTFIRNTHEGGYTRIDTVYFNQNKHTAVTSRTTMNVAPKTFDIVSAIYFMRTLSLTDFNRDSLFFLNFYLDDSVYYSAIKFIGRDTLKTKTGFIPTLKLSPMMATGEVFADKYPMFVWVTDDKKHIPVLISSKVIIGSVKAELIKQHVAE